MSLSFEITEKYMENKFFFKKKKLFTKLSSCLIRFNLIYENITCITFNDLIGKHNFSDVDFLQILVQ